ncbi:hypothetical protein V8D89_011901 [Ganoderma adspersum]
MLPMLLRAPTLTTFLLWAVPVAALVNVTIDDKLGDSRSNLVPQYTPSDGRANGEECTGCALHPGIIDVAQTVDQTWHDGTYHPGNPDQVISLTFDGVAIYVFNIIPNSAGGATTLTNLSFFLDHEYVGQFIHIPDQTTNIAYHVPVYVNESLPDAQHSLDIRATGPNASLVLFDYARYSSTTDDSSSMSLSSTFTSSSSTFTPSSSTFTSSSTSAKRGRIIGGVVGGVGGSIAVLVLVFICCRRSRKPRWQTQYGDIVEQTDTRPVHIPILRGAGDMFRPRPYPPPSNFAMMLSARGAVTRRDGGKGYDNPDTGTMNETLSQPPSSTLPSGSATGQSDLSVLEDLAAIRQEIARIREEQIVRPMYSVPPPYVAEEHE